MPICPTCNQHFILRTNPKQRTCSRKCSWRLRKVLYGPRGSVNIKPKPKRPIVVLVCAFCECQFLNKCRGKKRNVCCSKSCASFLKARRLGHGVEEERKCKECGKSFQARLTSLRAYCSRSCLASNKMKRPKFKQAIHNHAVWKKISRGLKRFHRSSKGLKLRREISLRETGKIRSPESIAKGRATKLEKGTLHIWTGERGGNGRISVPQQILRKALSKKWKMEFAIPTEVPKSPGCGYPTCYKADFALPRIKLAVEVDGGSHLSRRGILKDAKKTAKLNELGWRVLRFTNKDVMTNLSRVLSAIKSAAKVL